MIKSVFNNNSRLLDTDIQKNHKNPVFTLESHLSYDISHLFTV